jgi:hypothetical protein
MRDYIGSADAIYIYKKNYVGLIKNKLREDNGMNPRMSRGVFLENDAIEQALLDVYENIEYQAEIRHPALSYCMCHVDALADGRIFEVKTSEKDIPSNVECLIQFYPNYYAQIQWQMWCGWKKEACLLWVRCPPIDSDESPYDEYGDLDIKTLIIQKDELLFRSFNDNAPEFWKQWESARDNETSLDKVIDIDSLVAQETELANMLIGVKIQEDKIKAARQSLMSSMEKHGVVKYENDLISISYVGESIRKVVDNQKLKDDGLYDEYVKESRIKPSVRIKLKKGADFD